MIYKKQTLLTILVASMLLAIPLAQATPTYHLPKDTIIRKGLKVHFGDYWIYAVSGTNIKITAWFENGWTNCTVYASGTQQIYNGSKPNWVWINSILRDEGSGWSYSSGIVTITGATSSFALYWGTLGGEPPTYSNIAHSTTLVNSSCKFSCLWTDGGGLSGFIFSWKQGTGAWINDTWQALSGTSAWANVSKTLPNTVGTLIYYRWFCNDTTNLWSNTPSTTSLTTIGYYFYFDYTDMDFNDIDSIITWTLWKGGTQVSYTEGQRTLIAGSYDLKSNFRGHQIRNDTISTTTYGNSHVPLNLYVKKLGTTTRYVGFDKPITWISLNSISDSLTSFSVTSSSSNILMIVDVPRECVYIQKNGVNETGWTYADTPSNHEYKNVSSLSTWEFYHPLLIPPLTPSTTFFFRSDSKTTNNVTAYYLHTTESSVSMTLQDSSSSSLTAYYAFTVQLLHSWGSTTTLGDKIGTITLSSNFTGYKTSTWACPQTTLAMDDASEVTVWSKLGSGDWVAKAVYVTDQLISKRLNANTWTFTLKVSYAVGSTLTSFSFGNSNSYSRIEGVSLKPPVYSEIVLWYLINGNLLGALSYGYLKLFGAMFYGLILFGVCSSLYVSYRKIAPVVFLFILFGGVGGLVWAFVPEVATTIAYAFLVLGLAVIIWRVIR